MTLSPPHGVGMDRPSIKCEACQGRGNYEHHRFYYRGHEFGSYATCDLCNGTGREPLPEDRRKQK